MRKILFAALLCGSALAMTPAASAHALTTRPNEDGTMLIPTFTTGTAHVIPVQYWRHRPHYWHHRRHWHRHYR